MPIITCGGMRMQQTWKPPDGYSLKDVTSECQRNFEVNTGVTHLGHRWCWFPRSGHGCLTRGWCPQAIVDRAMQLGINHFETARYEGTPMTWTNQKHQGLSSSSSTVPRNVPSYVCDRSMPDPGGCPSGGTGARRSSTARP
jgi:hypothetical protein